MNLRAWRDDTLSIQDAASFNWMANGALFIQQSDNICTEGKNDARRAARNDKSWFDCSIELEAALRNYGFLFTEEERHTHLQRNERMMWSNWWMKTVWSNDMYRRDGWDEFEQNNHDGCAHVTKLGPWGAKINYTSVMISEDNWKTNIIMVCKHILHIDRWPASSAHHLYVNPNLNWNVLFILNGKHCF